VGIGSSDNWVEDLDWIEGDEDIDEVLSGVAVDDDGKVSVERLPDGGSSWFEGSVEAP
jgi:hypothetical protein